MNLKAQGYSHGYREGRKLGGTRFWAGAEPAGHGDSRNQELEKKKKKNVWGYENNMGSELKLGTRQEKGGKALLKRTRGGIIPFAAEKRRMRGGVQFRWISEGGTEVGRERPHIKL